MHFWTYFSVKKSPSYPLKKEDLSLPSPLIYYVFQSLSLKQQIKISQCSHSLLNRVRRIRGCDVDVLVIDIFVKTCVQICGCILFASINAKDLHKLKRCISVKSGLIFSFVNRNYIYKALNLIDYSKMKFNDRMLYDREGHYPALSFQFCQIDRNIFDKFLTVPLRSLTVRDIPNYDYKFDILQHAFTHFKNLKAITVPWQMNNITYNNLLAENKHIIKLSSCAIEFIPESINPKILAKFARNNMEKNGILRLFFSINIIIQPSQQKQLELFMKNEMSNDFLCVCGKISCSKNDILNLHKNKVLRYIEFKRCRCIRFLRYAMYKIGYWIS